MYDASFALPGAPNPNYIQYGMGLPVINRAKEPSIPTPPTVSSPETIAAKAANARVVSQLNAIPALKEIQQFAVNNQDRAVSPESSSILNGLIAELPEGEMKSELAAEKRDLGNLKQVVDKHLKGFGLGASQDLGGHGGTKLVTVNEGGQKHELFLKPKDEVELRNYKIINQLDPNLSKFMPRVYGEIRIDNKEYLVMENTRKSQEGHGLKQLADIKLSGKIDGKSEFNPIYDKNETVTTRGKEKGRLNAWQMGKGAALAPDGFMVAHGPKIARLFNYRNSSENLRKSLQNASSDNLLKLGKSLKEIQDVLDKSPIALIGASIILVEQEDQSIKALLIDPAHIQVDESKRQDVESNLSSEEHAKVYYGKPEVEEDRFSDQKQSNINALKGLVGVITEKQVDGLSRKSFDATKNTENKENLPEFPNRVFTTSTKLNEVSSVNTVVGRPSSPFSLLNEEE